MKNWIVLLRGINVSGKRKIKMADLRQLLEELKFKNVLTYIQSGNIRLATSPKMEAQKIETKIKKAIEDQFGFDVPVCAREEAEWSKVIETNPFLDQKDADPTNFFVTFLHESPDPERQKEVIEKYNFLPDEFVFKGREVFLNVPNKYGKTKINNQFFESKLKVKATTRNWRTINKMAELLNDT